MEPGWRIIKSFQIQIRVAEEFRTMRGCYDMEMILQIIDIATDVLFSCSNCTPLCFKFICNICVPSWLVTFKIQNVNI